MPQASEKDRKRYRDRFGDIGCEHALAELVDHRGYLLSHDYSWRAPKGHTPTEEELFWLDFLIDEWDFGPLIR